jgi:hypothetical protein
VNRRVWAGINDVAISARPLEGMGVILNSDLCVVLVLVLLGVAVIGDWMGLWIDAQSALHVLVF